MEGVRRARARTFRISSSGHREEIRENPSGIKYYNPNVILGNVKRIADFMCLRGLSN